MRATDDTQVKTYACLPVVGLVPASFGDGRPPVFGSFAHEGLLGLTLVYCVQTPASRWGPTVALHTDTSCVDVARDYRPPPRRTNGVAPTLFRPCPQLEQHP